MGSMRVLLSPFRAQPHEEPPEPAKSSGPSRRAAFSKRCSVCGYRFEADLEVCPLDGVKLPQERPEVGQLGPYRLVERLGIGGMGAVYRAVHEKVGRGVAIKMLHLSLMSNRMMVQRFFDEARAINKIRHPNVVDVYDLVSAEDDLHMVMELLRGKDLAKVLSEGPLPAARAVNILEQVCGALYAAHERGVIHRDLKPANVFITRRGEIEDFVKLLDFGVAKLERPNGMMTAEGMTVGTPEYMAPEQAHGKAVDNRTDIYAVGCLAYEMLTGRHVFDGATPADIMVKHVTQPPVPMRQWNPMIPPALDAAVLHCLAKPPEARPANAIDLAQELSAAIGRPFDGSGAFMRWREWSDTTSETTGLGRTAAGISGTRLRRAAVASRRRQWLLAASALGFVMVAGLLALSFGRGSPKPAAPEIVPDVAMAPPTPAIAGRANARIRLQSTPPGADLYDASGNKLGVTPLDIDLPQEVRHRVRFVREGYLPAERTILVDGDTTILVELKAEPVRGRQAAANGREPGTTPPGSRTRKSVLKTGSGTINPFGP